MILAYIPSPPIDAIHLGPLTIRFYALAILAGIFVAMAVTNRRWLARGGRLGEVGDIAVWAVPFGIVGARIYSVITTPEPYFGPGGDPLRAFMIWKGGIGIWGAVAGGALGAWIVARKRGIRLATFADALAPGLVLAQAIGRWGNWFNQELFGRPTNLPWALHITRPSDGNPPGFYHPTFLYESLWCLGLAGLLVLADRTWRIGYGRLFALYVAGYTVGRFWIEALRVDQAQRFFGMRLNDWMSIIVFIAAVVYFVVSLRRHPGRETPEQAHDLASARDEPEPLNSVAGPEREDDGQR